MCNDREQFVDFKELSNKQEVTLGDGHTLDGTGIGTVRIETLLPERKLPEVQTGESLVCTKIVLQLTQCLQGRRSRQHHKF